MKSLLVMARNDHNEAMRVAAGLTIFGHEVKLVMLGKTGAIAPDNEFLEVLELADITPMTTDGNAKDPFVQITHQEMGTHLYRADSVLNF